MIRQRHTLTSFLAILNVTGVINNGPVFELQPYPGGATTALNIGDGGIGDSLKVHVANGVQARRLVLVGLDCAAVRVEISPNDQQITRACWNG